MAGIVRSDPKVKESIRHQTPLLIRSPNSEAAEDMDKIAMGLWNSLAEARRAAIA